MKEKYIKPEINVLMNIMVGGDDKDEDGIVIVGDAGGDLEGGLASGEDDGNW